jgi:hypothetical protein
MSHLPLFPDLSQVEEPSDLSSPALGELRLSRPVRNQVEMVLQELDALIGPEHRARAIWGLVERLDLSQFYTPIRAATDTPGRAATDPKVLLARLRRMAVRHGRRNRQRPVRLRRRPPV